MLNELETLTDNQLLLARVIASDLELLAARPCQTRNELFDLLMELEATVALAKSTLMITE
jgi:hypothetical protein